MGNPISSGTVKLYVFQSCMDDGLMDNGTPLRDENLRLAIILKYPSSEMKLMMKSK